MKSAERVACAKACRWVDEVIYPTPWFLSYEYIKSINCDFVAHDYSLWYMPDGTIADFYASMKEDGAFLPTLRITGLSTTNIVARILTNRGSFYRQIENEQGSTSKLELSYYECLKYGLCPSDISMTTRPVNRVLSNYIVQRLPLSWIRSKVVGIMCPVKLKV